MLESLRQRIASRHPRRCQQPGLKDSAVLIPVWPGQDGLTMLLCQRSQQLAYHAGQIAFPGGKWEPRDANLAETALREAHEEVGIHPASVQILGELDETWTPSGFRICSFVGFLNGRPTLEIDSGETHRVIEVDFSMLQDPGRWSSEYLVRSGTSYRLVTFRHDDNTVVWGATARILYRCLQCLGDFNAEDDEPWDRQVESDL